MATIALLLDHQEGHLIPTFPLSRRLQERGHRVVYLTVPDGGDFVLENGFEFQPILEDLYPKGTVQTLREGTSLSRHVAGLRSAGDTAGEHYGYVESLAASRDWERPVRALDPDLFVVLSLFPMSAMILRLRFEVPIALLTPFLRRTPKSDFARQVETVLLGMTQGAAALFNMVAEARPHARRLADVSEEVVALPELILCPQALELPRPVGETEDDVYYVEAPVGRERLSEQEDDFPWERLDPAKKLLLCSMGSQSYQVGEAALRRFYGTVARAAAAEPGWQLVLASGGQFQAADFPGLPADAIVARWIPQLALLRKAAAMITHGGLGAIREAIASTVPMVVFPFTSDQPDNAERVVHHRIGLDGSIQKTTPDELREKIRRIDADPSFRENLAKMWARFEEVESAATGVRLLERLAARRGNAAAGMGQVPTDGFLGANVVAMRPRA
jgi:zeaxanthin glucosyltransferase